MFSLSHGHKQCNNASIRLTYDVGPAGLDPAKPGRDAAKITLRVIHSSSDFCPTS